MKNCISYGETPAGNRNCLICAPGFWPDEENELGNCISKTSRMAAIDPLKIPNCLLHDNRPRNQEELDGELKDINNLSREDKDRWIMEIKHFEGRSGMVTYYVVIPNYSDWYMIPNHTKKRCFLCEKNFVYSIAGRRCLETTPQVWGLDNRFSDHNESNQEYDRLTKEIPDRFKGCQSILFDKEDY